MSGLEIKLSRIKSGLKGYELARLLHITPDMMSKIENGHVVPTQNLMGKIKKVLNVKGN